MSTPKIRQLSVIKQSHVTPNMIRVTLGGDDIQSLPEQHQGGYVKLIFPRPDGRDMRTYTIRHQYTDRIDLDFVAHHDGGPASSWAAQAKAGDSIMVGGPGPAKLSNPKADWHLFVGDMTALPAISVNLESLAEDAQGYAILEVLSAEDIQDIAAPAGMQIHWIVNPTPGQDSQLLVQQVQKLQWLPGQASVWAACEFSSMKALRELFKQQMQLSKDYLYLSSYWKLGINEEQHKVVKREDAETLGES